MKCSSAYPGRPGTREVADIGIRGGSGGGLRGIEAPFSVVMVSGIYPPEIGGPATHAHAFKRWMTEHGIEVDIVTVGTPRGTRDPNVSVVGRGLPLPVRLASATRSVWRAARQADIVYATGLHLPALVGARLSGVPVVLKIVGDPAWERSHRKAWTDAGFEDFQSGVPGELLRVRLMRRLQAGMVREADLVIVPSNYLADIVAGWCGQAVRPLVVPNGVVAHSLEESNCEAATNRTTVRAVCVGRLVSHKRVDIQLDALSRSPAVRLDVIGDGPEEAALRKRVTTLGIEDRVHFHGAVSHEQVLQALRDSDVLLLTSSYEGLPHVVLEALAVGTPVLTTAAGGTDEAVIDGLNGMVVGPDPDELAEALGHLGDHSVLTELTEGAHRTGSRWRFDRTASMTQSVLRETTGEGDRPTVVMFGTGNLPDHADDRRDRLAKLATSQRTVVVAPGTKPIDVPGVVQPLVPRRSSLFFPLGAMRALRFAARAKTAAIVCQSPLEGFAVLTARVAGGRRGRSVPVIVEVHGTWALAGRGYGRPARRHLARVVDACQRWALMRADAVRTVSDGTTDLVRQLGIEPTFQFSAQGRYARLKQRPTTEMSTHPKAVFVGSLEPVKGPDVLLTAWRKVLTAVPEASLAILGRGRLEPKIRIAASEIDSRIVVGFADGVDALARELDEAWLLALPSRSEGFGRVILEAAVRSRPTVATTTAGPTQLIEPGVTGLVVEPDNPDQLADAIIQLLENRDLTIRMGQAARQRFETAEYGNDFTTGMQAVGRWVKDFNR